jgi:hydroxyethylthiazole kinase-like uncharacterized protein yjeF
MRALEQAAIETGQVTGLELMERAGQGVVEAIFETWPELDDSPDGSRAGEGLFEKEIAPAAGGAGGAAPHSAAPNSPRDILDPKKAQMKLNAVVLCGPGNNGGDGFVVARLLHEQGWAVEVVLYGDVQKLPPDARVNCDRWSELGEVQIGISGQDRTVTHDADLVVDALFGTGLTRPLEGFDPIFLDLLEEVSTDRTRVVSVDIASGICADSGKALGGSVVGQVPYNDPVRAVFNQLTVTFHSMKLGHVLSDGPRVSGRVVVKDIGLEHGREGVGAVAPPRAREMHKRLGHKFSHGHALVLSGPPGKGGAARLAARGALRVGAGLVTVGGPMRAASEHAGVLNAIMVQGLDGTHGLSELLEDKRINALCLGPGLGLTGTTGELVKRALAARRATVLDADALSRFQRQPKALFDMIHEYTVLTPHGGEFARLFPDLAERLNETPKTGPAYSKADATRDAAVRAGCVVLFKGADTVIAAPDGRCSVHAACYEHAAPWLATAGSGDVLAGIITGLLARGYEPMQAAECGAWLHAEAARVFGPGLIAEDIPETLPAVLRALA